MGSHLKLLLVNITITNINNNIKPLKRLGDKKKKCQFTFYSKFISQILVVLIYLLINYFNKERNHLSKFSSLKN